jgi:hypothetical protein
MSDSSSTMAVFSTKLLDSFVAGSKKGENECAGKDTKLMSTLQSRPT